MSQQHTINVVRLREIVNRADLTLEQIARMCGVSRRQISYWMERGVIPAQGPHRLPTVQKVLLLKKQLDGGRNLRQAVRRVERQIAELETWTVDRPELSEHQLTELVAERLESIERGLQKQREAAASTLSQRGLRRLMQELEALDLERGLLTRAAGQSDRELAAYLGCVLFSIQRLSGELAMD